MKALISALTLLAFVGAATVPFVTAQAQSQTESTNPAPVKKAPAKKKTTKRKTTKKKTAAKSAKKKAAKNTKKKPAPNAM